MRIRNIILCGCLSLVSMLNRISSELEQSFAKASYAFSTLNHTLTEATLGEAKSQIQSSIGLVKDEDCEDEDVAMHLAGLMGDLSFFEKLEVWLQNSSDEKITEELRNLALSSCIYLSVVQKAFSQEGFDFRYICME